MAIDDNNLQQRVLFYAPNVHVGGGFVLLKSIVENFSTTDSVCVWLDERIRNRINVPSNVIVYWVKNSFLSRLNAELKLGKVSKKSDVLVCFHGIPPLLASKAKVNLFLQNRILLGNTDLKQFKFKTRIRLLTEQFLFNIFSYRVNAYWVQTPSMAAELSSTFASKALNINILPFMLPIVAADRAMSSSYDFVYVADGEAHKNHIALVNSWIHLAKKNLFPTLALTLTSRDQVLKNWIAQQVLEHDLKITDLGQMPHDAILDLYASSKALIFPSLSESFGLPLIEAASLGLPILAGELDFVRDVCSPAHTFDPSSSVSIARAVCRFLNQPESVVTPVSVNEFWSSISH